MEPRILTFAALLSLASISPLSAQSAEADPAAVRGNRSIALSAGGGGQIGYWSRHSERTDLGLDFGVQGLVSEGASALTVSATPAVKRYRASSGPLAPYSYIGVPLSIAISGDESAFGVGAVAAFGLEWLPVPQVSVGGHVGAKASYHQQGDATGPVEFTTISSGIRVHLYF